MTAIAVASDLVRRGMQPYITVRKTKGVHGKTGDGMEQNE